MQVGVGLFHSIVTDGLSAGVQADLFPAAFPNAGGSIGIVAEYEIGRRGAWARPYLSSGYFATQVGQPFAFGGGVDLVSRQSFGVRLTYQGFFGHVVYEPFDCVYFGYGSD